MVCVLCSKHGMYKVTATKYNWCIDDNGKNNKWHSMLYAFIWLVSGVGIIIIIMYSTYSRPYHICEALSAGVELSLSIQQL